MRVIDPRLMGWEIAVVAARMISLMKREVTVVMKAVRYPFRVLFLYSYT